MSDKDELTDEVLSKKQPHEAQDSETRTDVVSGAEIEQLVRESQELKIEPAQAAPTEPLRAAPTDKTPVQSANTQIVPAAEIERLVSESQKLQAETARAAPTEELPALSATTAVDARPVTEREDEELETGVVASKAVAQMVDAARDDDDDDDDDDIPTSLVPAAELNIFPDELPETPTSIIRERSTKRAKLELPLSPDDLEHTSLIRIDDALVSKAIADEFPDEDDEDDEDDDKPVAAAEHTPYAAYTEQVPKQGSDTAWWLVVAFLAALLVAGAVWFFALR